MENENMNSERSSVKSKAASNGIAFWVVVVMSAVVFIFSYKSFLGTEIGYFVIIAGAVLGYITSSVMGFKNYKRNVKENNELPRSIIVVNPEASFEEFLRLNLELKSGESVILKRIPSEAKRAADYINWLINNQTGDIKEKSISFMDTSFINPIRCFL